MIKSIAHIVSSLLASKVEREEDLETVDNLSPDERLPEDLAYAALLVDLSTVDGVLDPREEKVISVALCKLFPESARNVDDLISTGINLSNSFCGQRGLVGKIKEEYSLHERETIYNLIESVIAADSVTDHVEVFFKNKLKALLN